jgi:hypothetical protein
MKRRSSVPVSREEIFADNFIQTLLRSLDPEASLCKDATILLEKVGMDFIETVGKRAIEACQMRQGDLVLPSDVQFVLETEYGIHVSGGSPLQRPPSGPTDEYSDQLAAVSDFLAKAGGS